MFKRKSKRKFWKPQLFPNLMMFQVPGRKNVLLRLLIPEPDVLMFRLVPCAVMAVCRKNWSLCAVLNKKEKIVLLYTLALKTSGIGK